jgi:hypothetical protein
MSRTNSTPPTSIEHRTEHGDNPPGAKGAASGRFTKPLTEDRPGTSGRGAPVLHARLHHAFHNTGTGLVTAGTAGGGTLFSPTTSAEALGDGPGSSRGTGTPASRTDGDYESPAPPGSEDAGENVEVGQILSAIAEEVNRHYAAVCAGINADFVAAAAQARRTLPRGRAAGAVQTLRQARQAALTLARQTAKMEIHGRKQAAALFYRRNPTRPVPRSNRQPDHVPRAMR